MTGLNGINQDPDGYLTTYTERLSARRVPRVVIAPVAHTFLTRPDTTLGETECDRLAQCLYNVWL